jgi:tetratricopeptide (TPR) repeat protein
MQPSVEQLRENARVAYERKDYAAALEICELILAESPDFADVRHSAGLCLSFLGRPEEALAEFDRALVTNPGYVEALINRALVLHELGRYAEARDAFEQANRAERQHPGRFPATASARLANAHADLGDLYMEAGAPQDAVAQYRAALELRPKFLDIRNKLAAALLAMESPVEAVAELRYVLEVNPRFLAARLNLGLAFYRMGRHDDAAAEWRSAARIRPDHPQVRAYLSLIELTGSTRREGQTTNA